MTETKKHYLWTINSHDCFGPFDTAQDAHNFASSTGRNCYQVLNKPPFETTVVHAPKYSPLAGKADR